MKRRQLRLVSAVSRGWPTSLSMSPLASHTHDIEKVLVTLQVGLSPPKFWKSTSKSRSSEESQSEPCRVTTPASFFNGASPPSSAVHSLASGFVSS